MTFDEFKKIKPGSLCVIAQAGEPGVVVSENSSTGDVLLQVKRAGRGIVKEWHHYIKLGKL